MKWKDFKKTELFKTADIVVVKRDGKEVSPKPFDCIISAYPMKHREYPQIPAICVEIL